MSRNLRQRTSKGSSNMNIGVDSPTQATGLTVRSLQNASPQHMSNVQKLQVSIFYLMLPRFLQHLIHKLWIFSCLRPSWQSRYLILLGSYLYKFKDNGTDLVYQEPNGSPVRVEEMNAYLLSSSNRNNDDVLVAIQNLRYKPQCVFCVSTIRKKYYYLCANQEEAILWVNTLIDARQEATTRSMGHATKDSFPSSWSYFDNLGKNLVDRKDRIRHRLQLSNLQELEMSNLTEGGPAPRGYFG